MTKSETTKLLAMIVIGYPKFEIQELTAELWHELLGDIPFDVVKAAVKRIMLKSPFPPSIHDVRAEATAVVSPNEIDAAEAWGEVLRAVRNHGSYGEKEAMATLSPRARKVITWMGWREICMSEEVGVTRGQFLKMYGQVQERDKQDALLPEGLRLEGLKQIGGGRS